MNRHRVRVVCALAAALVVRNAPAVAQCCGDCNDDGVVTVDELVTAVNRALTSCSDDGVCGVNGANLTQCLRDLTSCRSQSSTPAFPATGQMMCWDINANAIPCAGTGQDGDIRAGVTLVYVDNGDGTITDPNTKLMWEKLSADDSIHSRSHKFLWADALGMKIAALNGASFAGHNDWRLPNVKELQSIVNYEIGFPGPTVSAAFNTACTAGCTVESCSCTQADSYTWSSTSNANDPDGAWYVDFSSGAVHKDEKVSRYFVRAVRGGP